MKKFIILSTLLISLSLVPIQAANENTFKKSYWGHPATIIVESALILAGITLSIACKKAIINKYKEKITIIKNLKKHLGVKKLTKELLESPNAVAFTKSHNQLEFLDDLTENFDQIKAIQNKYNWGWIGLFSGIVISGASLIALFTSVRAFIKNKKEKEEYRRKREKEAAEEKRQKEEAEAEAEEAKRKKEKEELRKKQEEEKKRRKLEAKKKKEEEERKKREKEEAKRLEEERKKREAEEKKRNEEKNDEDEEDGEYDEEEDENSDSEDDVEKREEKNKKQIREHKKTEVVVEENPEKPVAVEPEKPKRKENKNGVKLFDNNGNPLDIEKLPREKFKKIQIKFGPSGKQNGEIFFDDCGLTVFVGNKGYSAIERKETNEFTIKPNKPHDDYSNKEKLKKVLQQEEEYKRQEEIQEFEERMDELYKTIGSRVIENPSGFIEAFKKDPTKTDVIIKYSVSGKQVPGTIPKECLDNPIKTVFIKNDGYAIRSHVEEGKIFYFITLREEGDRFCDKDTLNDSIKEYGHLEKNYFPYNCLEKNYYKNPVTGAPYIGYTTQSGVRFFNGEVEITKLHDLLKTKASNISSLLEFEDKNKKKHKISGTAVVRKNSSVIITMNLPTETKNETSRQKFCVDIKNQKFWIVPLALKKKTKKESKLSCHEQ